MNSVILRRGVLSGGISGLALSLAMTLVMRNIGGSSLVNYGPALFGLELLSLDIFFAAVALVAGLVFVFGRRWVRASFCLVFGLIAVGYWVILWLAQVLAS